MQRVFQRAIAGVQRPGIAAVLVSSLLQRFGPAKVRQHVLIAPASRALLLPLVEVQRVAAHVHHAVDRRRPTQHLAPRRMQPAPTQMRLRLGLVRPVVFRHVHWDRQRAGHLDQHRRVGTAVLQQQHRGRAVLRQPVRQDAPGRTSADDHVIIDLRHVSPQRSSAAPSATRILSGRVQCPAAAQPPWWSRPDVVMTPGKGPIGGELKALVQQADACAHTAAWCAHETASVDADRERPCFHETAGWKERP